MKTEKKRLSVILLLIVSFFALAWQVYRLIDSDLSTDTVSKSHSNGKRVASSDGGGSASAAGHNKVVKADWSGVTPVSRSQQQAYLALANRIQVAKMRHRLLQQEVAIADAEKKLALSHTQVAKLSSQQTGVHGSSSWDDTPDDDNPHLVYLAKIADGKWEATVKVGRRYQHVQRGVTLPNGARVVAIIKNGLWLQDETGVHWLSFPGELAPKGRAAAPKPQKTPMEVQHIRAITAKPKQHGKLIHGNSLNNLTGRSVVDKVSVNSDIVHDKKRSIKEITIKKVKLRKKPQPEANSKPRVKIVSVSQPHKSAKSQSAKTIAVEHRVEKNTGSLQQTNSLQKKVAHSKSATSGSMAANKASKEPVVDAKQQQKLAVKTQVDAVAINVDRLPALPKWTNPLQLIKNVTLRKNPVTDTKSIKHTSAVRDSGLSVQHILSSDEMLFLEQPSQGVTLLSNATEPETMKLKKILDPVLLSGFFKLHVDGQKQWAIGLYKSPEAAKLTAMKLQAQLPQIVFKLVPVHALQQSVLHDSAHRV